MAVLRMSAPDPRHLGSMITSFKLHLHAEEKKAKTRQIYLDATTRLAGWLVAGQPTAEQFREMRAGATGTSGGSSPSRARPPADWSAVTKQDIQRYLVFLMEWGYASGYVSNQYRGFQQFFRWLSEEEGTANPMATLRRPAVQEGLPPVLSAEDMGKLIRNAEADKSFAGRRDAAILRLFACTGGRLSEIAKLGLAEISLESREALVHGKGGKDRHLKFDHRATRVVDRYLRVRAPYVAARQGRLGREITALWIGRAGAPMTSSGIRQAIERRAKQVGLAVNPHMFRHTFSHNWLDKGGAEGDLMELNGWESPQMLRRYGRSAAAARARRAYDRIDVMDGI